MRTVVLAALAASLFCGRAAAQQVLTPERVFASPDLSGPRARGVKLAPDGSAVTYLKGKADDLRTTDLWIADVAGGAPRLLIDGAALTPKGRTLSDAEKSRRERAGVQTRGVVDYEWDEQGRYVLVPVEGDLWLYQRAGGKVRQLTDTKADEIDAKVSPKGSFVSFVRDDNLYVLPTAGGAERALTEGGTELKSWATAEFIAQEEMDRLTGYWWSPDEARIALTLVDQTGVDVIDRPEVNAAGATVVHERYPRAGRPNARVDLYVEDVASGARTKVDLGADPDIYLARVDWSKDGRTLYVQRLSRDQRRLDLLAVDPKTGAARPLLTETSAHWVELTNDFRPLKDGSFLWSSERSGNRHLYLYSAAGELLRQVTRGDWPVDALEGVDEARGLAIFGASKESPVERRLYSVSYRTPAEPRALTPAGGWWTETVAKTGGAFAGTYQDPATPPQTALYAADGKRVRWIEENRLADGHPFYPYLSRLRIPQFGTLKAADGQRLWWSMRTPPGFDPAKRYPVIVQVYGGPASALVTRQWATPEDQLLLEAGFILFRLDNRGTPNRSVAFKTALDRRVGQAEVDDQLAGAAYLKSLAFVDPARIGVTGWSNGGYMTLLLLSAADSPFAAGVAGAPVSDWSLYDTAYTERYMGKPQENVAGYQAADVLPRLPRLKPDSLLILHGMADDNVTFDQSTRVFAALQAQGTPFETMVYPGLRHRAGWTPANRLHRARMTLDFFTRKLKGGG
ncbi:S9 family peptidase [Phenylobacterium hankyongense]|uniref:S9 family peptidase n=1 Tax=Phenylobacterium hankyongense TaxID=1813876 RepID=A0A328AUL9_9CAUL|nr:S9 family peptidase [Phenylobacterium hankyongense]RAK58723.1 S9 family peptidase [Phenylobacterium hankyongense]